MSRVSGHYAITKQAVTELKRERGWDPFIRDFHDAAPGGPPSGNDYIRIEFLINSNEFDDVIGYSIMDGITEDTIGTRFVPFRSPQYVSHMCEAAVDLGDGAVCKDIEDLIDGNHWSKDPLAQAGHFMRAEGHTPASAYETALGWIEDNVLEAGLEMGDRYARLPRGKTYDLRGHPHVRAPLPREASGKLTGGKVAQKLGRAVHALQDSFSASHVRRAPGNDETHPGAIEDILVYTEEIAQKGGEAAHAAADRAWMVPERRDPLPVPGGWVRVTPAHFSFTGREAINATKALIELAIWIAEHPMGALELSSRWQQFVNQWLLRSTSLRG